jgi:hypothetical protein
MARGAFARVRMNYAANSRVPQSATSSGLGGKALFHPPEKQQAQIWQEDQDGPEADIHKFRLMQSTLKSRLRFRIRIVVVPFACLIHDAVARR